MTVLFHNKGIDLPKILNSRNVSTIPDFLDASLPPIVGYTYTRTISGKIFNQKSVVGDFDVGTGDIQCNCCSSDFLLWPCTTCCYWIIRDVKIRQLIANGPSYRVYKIESIFA